MQELDSVRDFIANYGFPMLAWLLVYWRLEGAVMKLIVAVSNMTQKIDLLLIYLKQNGKE